MSLEFKITNALKEAMKSHSQSGALDKLRGVVIMVFQKVMRLALHCWCTYRVG